MKSAQQLSEMQTPAHFSSYACPWPVQFVTDIRSFSRAEDVSSALILLATLQILLYHYTGLEEQTITCSFTDATEPPDQDQSLQIELHETLTENARVRELLANLSHHLHSIYTPRSLPPALHSDELSSPWQMQLGCELPPTFFYAEKPFTGQEPISQRDKCNLFLCVENDVEKISCSLIYDANLLDAATIARVAGHLYTLLEALLTEREACAAALPLLTEAERELMLGTWNATTRDYPSTQCLHQFIETQVLRTPDAPAVLFAREVLTFRQLNERANQLAHFLRRLGVGQDMPVGVFLERSLEMVIALLGILKAGGAYVPLDPALPADRVAFMLADMQTGVPEQTSVLLTLSTLATALPEHEARVICLDTDWVQIAAETVEDPPVHTTPDNLAYIIYTSGSTGKPKGAMNTHRGICNRLLWMQEAYQLTAADCVLQKTPFSFDVSVWEFFWPLMTGARLVLARPEGHKDSAYLVALIQDQQVTTLHFVPSMLQIFLEEPGLELCTSLRQVLCSGEALPYPLQERFFARHPAALHNLYGPTEAAVDVTFWPCQRESARKIVPIGYPIANIQIYILNRAGQPVPIGVPGELYIGGVGVARGYLNRAALTAERFLDDPFTAQPGARLYRTGDLARYLPDGAIEYLGRIDQQIKLRGFRIELGEIEVVLGQYPAVREAVVLARGETTDDRRLVAYVVLHRDQQATVSDLREYLALHVPDYMIPSAFVLLDAFPLNPSGKVDRRALPPPADERPDLATPFVAPRTASEEFLAATWARVLGLKPIGVDDNFFALGGHSLLAMQIIAHLRRVYQIELSLRAFFDAPTVAQQAARVENWKTSPQPAPMLAPLRPLERAPRQIVLPGQVAPSTVAVQPISFAQQNLWFLDQMTPQNPAYNIPATIHITTTLRFDALQRSLQAIVQRHEILRATFMALEDGQPYQVVVPELNVLCTEVDLRHLSQAEREAQSHELAGQLAARPFDLARGPLFRFTLLHLGEREHILVLVLHHIISDGWSINLFFQELVTLYEGFVTGQPASLPDLPVQYADFAAWQRAYIQGERQDALLAYWKRQLAEAPTVLELPGDRPRPATPTLRGATYHFSLSGELTGALKKFSQQEGVTLYTTLVAAFQTLLHRYTGQDDLVLGTAMANRQLPEVQDLQGMFLDTLALRLNFANNPTVRNLFQRTRDVILDATAHQDMPFELLVNELRLERVSGQNPLFQVLLTLDPPAQLERGSWRLTRMAVGTGASKFDLSLELDERPEGLFGHLEYNGDLFEEASISRMAAHWQVLLAGMVADPTRTVSHLPLLTAQEQQLLREWNATRVPYPTDRSLPVLFAEQAARTPQEIAVTFEGTSLTYGELNARANQLAHFLRTLGVGPDVLVAICVERSLEMVIGLLGILKAGGAYVPLDPTYPQDRLAFMLEDAEVSVLLTQQTLLAHLPAHQARVVCLDAHAELWGQLSVDNPPPVVTATHLCYVIYTSGSTGKPKGVQIPHQAVVNFLLAMQREPGLSAHDTLLAVTTLSFDIAGLELYLPLLTGAHLVIASREVATSGSGLAALLEHTRATLMQATPITWRLLLAAGWTSKGDLKALCGGEALPAELARELLPRVSSLYNMYGPTETTIWSTLSKIESEDQQISIGRPIANTRLAILDHYFQPLPPGIPGELYIGGDGLARGYLNRPTLTDERFLSVSILEGASERLYRTGDLARYRRDGSVELIGRLDHQIKLRGFRIELGEIESVLEQHPAIGQAVAMVREDTPGDRRLVAYICASEQQRIALNQVHQHAQKHLPYYMVPSALVVLDELPRTPNGKVDRRALPLPDLEHRETGESFVAPRTALEKEMAAAWSHVLGVQEIGIQDNFFVLGGDSLRALQVTSQLRTTLQAELTLRNFFEAPTIAQLAQLIAPAQPGTATSMQPTIQPQPRPSNPQTPYTLPASSGQQGLWFLHQLNPQSPSYNIFATLRLRQAFDLGAFEQSLSVLSARHEALRTTFTLLDGQLSQVIAPQLSIPLICQDIRVLSLPQREQEALGLATEEFQRPFDLARGPLVRALVLHLDEQEHLLLLTMHHAISDGWSLGILLQELVTLYTARLTNQPAQLAEVTLQAGDIAAWQHAQMRGTTFDEHLAYWKAYLAGAPTVLDLPADHPRSASSTQRGAQHTFQLSRELTNALKALSQQEQVTLYMTLVAAFQVLLQRYTGQDDLLLGTTTAGRPRAEMGPIVGYFTNTLVLRANFTDNLTVRDLLGNVREAVLHAQLHQEVPFELLTRELQPDRIAGRSPLFQVFLTMDTPLPSLPSVWDLTQLDLATGASKYDLSLDLAERAGSLVGHLEYNADLFDASTIERFAEHWQLLLQAMVDDPTQSLHALSLLSEQERQQLLVTWNATEASYPREKSIQQLFAEQVARTPASIAATFEQTSLTYQELNVQANQLAHYLQKRGLKPGQHVGVFLDRSLEMLVGLLGILKAGCIYVPLDPSYPLERLTFMLEDAQIALLLTRQNVLAKLPASSADVICLDRDWADIARESQENPANLSGGTDCAYMIYTSGSTGKPKGVLGTHQASLNRFHWMWRTYPFSDNEVCCQKTTLNFVDSIWEIFGPLLRGVKQVLIPDLAVKDPARLLQTLAQQKVTRIVLVPSLLRVLLESSPNLSEQLPALKYWVCSGEALPIDLVELFYQRIPQGTLLNLYGSSEVAADATYYEVRPGLPLASVPIGRPIDNTRVYLLDRYMQLAPVGVAGELHIAGDGLARGYFQRPELTEARFVADPFGREPGALLYKTGDFARYLPDGTLEYLGRLDQQVKLRGMRVELGEIETALNQHPAVGEAVATIREDTPGDQRLVAYVVLQTGQSATASDLQRYLSQQLPAYMVPGLVIFLPAFPLTPNGKVNRRALPAPDQQSDMLVSTYVTPELTIHYQLIQIWEELLNVRPIGIRDDFFALGGHSLLAARLITRIAEVCGRTLPLSILFENATIEGLARVLQEEIKAQNTRTVVTPIQASGSLRPFFFLHGDWQGKAFYCIKLARELGPERPFYLLEPYIYHGLPVLPSLEQIAAAHIAAMRAIQPEGPYLFGGWCNGALIAYEMARQLQADHQQVQLLVMMDAGTSSSFSNLLRHVIDGVNRIFKLTPSRQDALFFRLLHIYEYVRLWSRHRKLLAQANIERPPEEVEEPHPNFASILPPAERLHDNYMAVFNWLAAGYKIRPYGDKIAVFWATDDEPGRRKNWARLFAREKHVQTYFIPGTHMTSRTRHIAALAKSLRECISESEEH